MQRVLEMARAGFFKEIALFRAVQGWVTQLGISGSASMNQQFDNNIIDDPMRGVPFLKGYLAFAGSGTDSRSHQLFIAMADQAGLGTRLHSS